MASATPSESVDSELHCSICLETCVCPSTLSCGHSFCLRCLEAAWETANSFSCPRCRVTFPVLPRLRGNVALANLVEQPSVRDGMAAVVVCDICGDGKTPAVKTCLRCEISYCVTHLLPHLENHRLSHHTVVAPTASLDERRCPEHWEELKFYCTEDSSLVCLTCTIAGKHRGHKVLALKDKHETQKTLVGEETRAVEEKRKKAEESVKRMEAARKEAQMSLQRLVIEDRDILVAPHCAGDTYSFIASSSGTYRCQATDIIFEMIAAGQVHYTWKELPAELHREKLIPISSAFDISCDNQSLHALRIPHYLDVEHWKDLSKIKMFHLKDGNINLEDPSEVSATHARVKIQSLSLFALILQFWGVPYRVKAVVLVFKVPGALLKLEVHLIPDDIATVDRIRKKLKKEKYEYFQIPTKCHESLTVDESYSLSCDIEVKRIQPKNLKMENSCNENNFFHILFKSEFEELCLTVKKDRNKKSVWQRTIHWQERDGAETPWTEQSPRENYLYEKIISETSTLAAGLQCKLTPILNEFQAKKILTTAEIGETSAKFKNQGGYDAASHLIVQIIHKGPSVSTQVWEALWKTRNTYKQLHGLLREVFPDRE